MARKITIPDKDALRRMSKATRMSEGVRFGESVGTPLPPSADEGKWVRILGESGSGDSGSECGLSGSGEEVIRYPARFVYKDSEECDLDLSWKDVEGVEDCWVEELNGGQLEPGRRYRAWYAGEYKDLALLVTVLGGGVVDCEGCEESGSGPAHCGTLLSDLLRCSASGSGESGSGESEAEIREVRLAVRVCGELFPVVAIDVETGEVIGGE